jgi:hypothetical protein
MTGQIVSIAVCIGLGFVCMSGRIQRKMTRESEGFWGAGRGTSPDQVKAFGVMLFLLAAAIAVLMIVTRL